MYVIAVCMYCFLHRGRCHVVYVIPSIVLCRLIYPGLCTNVFNHYHRIQMLWQLCSYLCYLWLSLQPSSVWRHLWMVLETTGNANRFLRLGPPLHWWSPLRSPSTSPLWCYSRSGVGCIVLRLCWVKVLRPGCVWPPSRLFQTICAPPPVSSYSPMWWYGRGCRRVCVSRPLMWWNSVSYVLQIWPSVSVRFPQHYAASHSSQLIVYTGSTTLSFPNGSFGWIDTWCRVFIGLKYVGIPYPGRL